MRMIGYTVAGQLQCPTGWSLPPTIDRGPAARANRARSGSA